MDKSKRKKIEKLLHMIETKSRVYAGFDNHEDTETGRVQSLIRADFRKDIEKCREELFKIIETTA